VKADNGVEILNVAEQQGKKGGSEERELGKEVLLVSDPVGALDRTKN